MPQRDIHVILLKKHVSDILLNRSLEKLPLSFFLLGLHVVTLHDIVLFIELVL